LPRGRLDNLVYDPSDPAAVLAVLDWELSTLGDPLADLAYNCLPYHMPEAIPGLVRLPRPLPPGIPEEQQYIQQYCAARGLPYPLQAPWPFYLALSLFRLASILAGVGARAAQGNASSRSAAQMGSHAVVRSLACRGLEMLD
jgi:aminoglycoside phosphotransferase (APT) family kinase protein